MTLKSAVTCSTPVISATTTPDLTTIFRQQVSATNQLTSINTTTLVLLQVTLDGKWVTSALFPRTEVIWCSLFAHQSSINENKCNIVQRKTLSSNTVKQMGRSQTHNTLKETVWRQNTTKPKLQAPLPNTAVRRDLIYCI